MAGPACRVGWFVWTAVPSVCPSICSYIYTPDPHRFSPPPLYRLFNDEIYSTVDYTVVSCLTLCLVNSINYVVAPPPAAALYIYLSAICLGLVVTNATKDAVVCRRGELLAIIYHGPHWKSNLTICDGSGFRVSSQYYTTTPKNSCCCRAEWRAVPSRLFWCVWLRP